MKKIESEEQKAIRKAFRATRDKLKKQIQAYDDNELALDEVSSAIKLQYSVGARLENELDKVPKDAEFLEYIDNLVELSFDGKIDYTKIPTKAYKALINKIERLEAKVSRVKILDMLGKQYRLLTQNIVSSAQIGELQANTKRIEITTHHATLDALARIFYLAMREQGLTEKELASIAGKLKRLQKDYPIMELDFEDVKGKLYAGSKKETIEIEADFEEVDDRLDSVNSLVSKKARRGRK